MKPTAPTIRRFYKTVSTEKEGRSWTILLDEKTVHTPARAILRVPTEALANLLVAEWDAQSQTIRANAMPMTKLANVAADHMGMNKAQTAGELVRFATGDVCCFRVAEPLELQELQARKLDAWLDWAELKFGSRLGVTNDLRPPQMPLEALENMRNTALEMEPFLLTALAHAASILGSAVLGFAMAEGELDAKSAFDLSRIEEDWQAGRWGVDDEAVERAANLLDSLRASESFMQAVKR